MDAAETGDSSAAQTLFAALYSELHRLAARELARRGSSVTLGATTLLHEAYLDMAGRSESVFPSRAQFMSYAARAMRGIIIDHVRSRNALRRGGQFEITSIGENLADEFSDHQGLVNMSEALDELTSIEPELARVVDLKFFCGFSFTEIAAMRAVSERTVQRNWQKARIYLHDRLRNQVRL